MFQKSLRQIGCLTLWLATTATADAPFDTRTYDDLNGVIMLCATQPASARFDAAWVQWVRANPDADVASAVQTVVSRAATVRSMAVPGMEPVRPGSQPSAAAISERMTALARSATARNSP